MGEAIVIIPARGGSKGVPRKNVMPFLGVPLVVHSIRHGLGSAAVSRVIVSTDDAEIAAVSRGAGAAVVSRPADISGDAAASEPALLHTLEVLKKQEQYEPELVVFLQATSPIRDSSDLDRAVAQLRREGADSLVSVCASHDFLWTRDAQGRGIASNYNPRARPRRQDMAPQFRENGSLYVFKAAGFCEQKCRLFGTVSLFEQEASKGFQIDSAEDFRIAEAIARAQSGHMQQPISGVKLVVFDFDGVMSDNRVLVMQDGTEGAMCNRSDGLGLGMLRDAGMPMLVLSKEQNPVVGARCRKLKIECRQGIDDKLTELRSILSERGIAPEHVAYVGNDINDLACMRYVGMPIAVADAYPEVLAVAKRVTARAGGCGAVREVCEWMLASRASDRDV